MSVLGVRMSARQAVLAAAPSPGVEMTRRVLLNAVQILRPDLRRATASAAVVDLAGDPLAPLVRLRPGLFTTSDPTAVKESA